MNARIHEPLVLHPDTRFIPIDQLPASVRQALDCSPEDVAVSRRGSRGRVRVVDAEGSALLRQFESPRPILEAVVRHCLPRGLDPVAALEGAFPLLERMTRLRCLVPAAEPCSAFEPSLEVGDTLAGYRVRQRIRVLEDSEIYQVEDAAGRPAALKLVPLGASPARHRALARESTALAHLAGPPCPRLLAQGVDEGGRYLVMEWCPGTDAAAAARVLDSARGRLRLCVAVVRAFGRLHRRGVLHGDVHPGNVRVDEDGTVRLVDLGNASGLELGANDSGSGLEAFYAPECAAALRAGTSAPASTPASEQYGIAALVYQLLTGHAYQRWSLERDAMLAQIVERGPRPFAGVGASPWPEVEAILARALHKDPSARWSDLDALADALAAVPDVTHPSDGAPRSERPDRPVLDHVLPRFDLDSTLATAGLPQAPTASVNFGAAGVAYLWLRVATVREDPQALALADLWITRAEHDLASPTGLGSEALPREHLGDVSLYHGEAGVHCLRTLVSAAQGDRLGASRACARLIECCERPGDDVDLVLGRPGLLLGASFAYEALRGEDTQPDDTRVRLRAAGDGILRATWSDLSDEHVADRRSVPWLGIAHGWAGVLYATLAWCRASEQPLPAAVPLRLRELAQMPDSRDGADHWPRAAGSEAPAYWPGWCHGSAGHVLLWDLAHEVLGEDEHRRRADRAAEHAWQHARRSSAGLCCGAAGQAYALLNRYRRTGDPRWLRRARVVADHAMEGALGGTLHAASLYKGDVGIAVLAVELERPEHARMPMFELDGA